MEVTEKGFDHQPQPWESYYKNVEDVKSLGIKVPVYKSAFETLSIFGPRARYPEILDPAKPMTFVLGGFHPTNGTPQDFAHFVQEIHPNHDDTLWYVDINEYPIKHLATLPDIPSNARTLRSPIQNLHVRDINMMFVDETLSFLSDEEVKQFAGNTSDLLTPYGFVAVTQALKMKMPWTNLTLSRTHNVPTRARSVKNIRKLTEESLKTVLVGAGKAGSDRSPFSIIVLARKDSPYSEHSGASFDYYDRF